MKLRALIFALLLCASSAAQAREAAKANEYRQLTAVNKLTTALDPQFQFRKTKLSLVGDTPSGKIKTTVKGNVAKDPAVNFDQSYRLYGAVTGLDQHMRAGN